MEMKDVKSSNIHSIGYDAEKNVLHVKFSSGKTYSYEGVGGKAFNELLNATSVGSHFAKHIRNSHKAAPVD